MIVNPVSWLIFQQLSYATLHRFSRGYPVNRDGHNFPPSNNSNRPHVLATCCFNFSTRLGPFLFAFLLFFGFGCCFYSLHHRSTCELSNGLPHRDTDTDRQFAFFAAFHRGVGRHHHRGVAVWSRRRRAVDGLNELDIFNPFLSDEWTFSESTFFNGFQK